MTLLQDQAQNARASDKPHRVCPWWIGYLLASPLRRIFQKPEQMLAPHVKPGMTVLEPGPGMGFFTLELARLVGVDGRVIAVDIQPRMLEGLSRRAARAGLSDRIELRRAPPDSMRLEDLAATVDFTLAAAVVHEMPSATSFFRQVASASKAGAQLLLVEPRGHVSIATFEDELRAAYNAGFKFIGKDEASRSHTAVLERTGA